MKSSEFPEIVYKYRSWKDEFHKKILNRSQVYLSSPKFFNDPFDFGIVKNFLSLDTREKIEKYIDHEFEKHKNFLEKEGYDIDKEREFQLERFRNPEEFQKEYETIEMEAISKHYGILSLSGRWDSILMWAHYGDFHKGFNVGYNEEKMRNSRIFGAGGPVIYSNEYPYLNPFDEHTIQSFFTQSHYKSKEWEYEEEYRLTKLFYPNLPSEDDRIKEVPFEFIEEINLGLNIEEEDKGEIMEIAKSKGIKVYQINKIPFRFKLARVII